MEEVLISIAKDTPILALLGVVLVIVFRMQRERDKEQSEERGTFIQTIDKMNEVNGKLAESNGRLLESVKDNGIELKNFMRVIEESHSAAVQSHQYQRVEHEQMIEVLKKLNGKS